ncbi:lipopolysaccharide assembly protein B [Arenicella chitinivorans]|uniref:Lipopolysaccharide assembly protein B n=1 Tax=Arenicella chitinivorans TaxID=1329800 RepID=A0A918VIS7_9GAMM|nr:hypothetical protein [Arenicella chitinivorans]GGZ99462.1 lipopolysaccharide assembly protein B [Arenicella chitinivorans]
MITSMDWLWPVLFVVLLVALFANLWFGYRRYRTSAPPLDYLRGVNFVLNEETDKAIDLFLKAIEVDKDTVELHLALGGLFRKSGQFDRATRIHQNLIARPHLTDAQRANAVYELAQDYHKVGWLDRAENLYRELLDISDYQVLATDGLVAIYHQENDWQQAIESLLRLPQSEQQARRKSIANYYCELAEQFIELRKFTPALLALESAHKQGAGIGRVDYLFGALYFAQGDYPAALEAWHRVRKVHPALAHRVIGNLVEGYQAMGNADGLALYLLEERSVPRDKLSFVLWSGALKDVLGEASAITTVCDRVTEFGYSAPVSAYLLQMLKQAGLSSVHKDSLLTSLLNREKNRQIEYTCNGCGFDTKAMYWHCPNCGQWESFH